MLRAVSDKPHGLNGFLNETVADLRHVISTVQSAQEIGVIKKEQVINIIDSIVQRTTFGGGEGGASFNIKDSVVQRTTIKVDEERKKREEERRSKEREEKESLRKQREEEAQAQREKEEAERRRKEEEVEKQRQEVKERERIRIEKKGRITTTPTPAPAPSDGWKSKFVTAIVILVFIGAGYLLYANWAYVDGIFLERALTVAPKFGCSSPEPNVYVLSFNEDSTTLTTMCSEPLTAGQKFSLEVVKGDTAFWDGKINSNVGAEGVVSSQNAYKLEAGLPLGMLLVTVGGEPWLGIGKSKTYYKVTSNSLEVSDGTGKLLRSFPITLPKEAGGWGSKVSLAVNCQGRNADQSKVCTAAYEVRQEYYTK
jgi:hypothetical protein